MRANVWSGRNTVQVENVPDPKILNDRDAIVKVTSTAICGSDLHLYDGYIPTMKRGDILGHEFMGEVVETGKGVGNLQAGDRVVVPFTIACGDCWSCRHELYSVCENSNPNAGIAEKMFGQPTAGIFGYSHITWRLRGRAGRVRARAIRGRRTDQDRERPPGRPGPVPVGHLPHRLLRRRPMRHRGRRGVAVFGAGPVGQFAIASAPSAWRPPTATERWTPSSE
jgi:threonine dehydrogenase-like Zn-dependent dehydrogenase